MRKETNMAGVKSVAKALLMLDIHLTDYSPVIVQHPFTSSGMVAAPTENGLAMLDITQGDENLSAWRGLMVKQIDQAKNAYHIYMMLNKSYALSFLSLAEPHLSQKDFSKILADAWIRSENPNMDKNFVKKSLVDMFKKADQSILMDGEEKDVFDSFDDTVTIYRGVTSYNAKNIKALSWTTEYQTAEWFAHRFGEEGTVYEAQISKEHILAFFNGRNESEVIVDPKYLTDITEAQLYDLLTELKETNAPIVTTFYCPLTGQIHDEEDGGMNDVDGRFLSDYISEIEEKLEHEQNPDFEIADYITDHPTANAKLKMARWSVEEIGGVLYGRIDCRSAEAFTPEEIEAIKDGISGQNSDGFGEGFEQREISTDEGDLYVSFWHSGDDYFIHTQEEMDEYINQGNGLKIGGM